jgi:energy-coupling factor transporter ATP-binding protein EcfA2
MSFYIYLKHYKFYEFKSRFCSSSKDKDIPFMDGLDMNANLVKYANSRFNRKQQVTHREIYHPKRLSILSDPVVIDSLAKKLDIFKPKDNPKYTLSKEQCMTGFQTLLASNITETKLFSIDKSFVRRQEGRMIQQGVGYQQMPRDLRAFLTYSVYRDFDLKNCHPTLALHLAKKYNLPCVFLQEYANKRDTLLAEYIKETGMSKEDLKMAFIYVLFGGKIPFQLLKRSNSQSQCTLFLQCFQEEANTLGEYIVQHKGHFLDKVPFKKTNPSGSALAKVLHILEGLILDKIALFFSNKESTFTLVFDGLLVLSMNNEFTSEDLKNCDKFIENETGFKLTLAEKCMHQQYLAVLDHLVEIGSLLKENVDDLIAKFAPSDITEAKSLVAITASPGNSMINVEEADATSDLRIAHALLESDAYKNRIYSLHGIPLFKMNDTWSYISKDIHNNIFVELCRMGKGFFRQSSFVMRVSELVLKLAPHAPTNFLDRFNYNNGLIPFANGIYNATTQTFIESYDGYHFLEKLDIPYPKEITKELLEAKEFLKAEVLQPVLGDCNDPDSNYIPFLEYMAKAITFDLQKKKMCIIIGARDCGKTTLIKIISSCLSPCYSSFNTRNLITSKQGVDPELANKWIIQTLGKMFMIASEAELPDGLTWNGDLIKRMVGGDYIPARGLYSTDVMVRNNACFVISVNSYPAIYPNDAQESIIYFRLDRRFVPNAEWGKLSQLQKNTHAIINNELEQTVSKDPLYQTAMVLVLLDHYKPGDYIETESSKNEKTNIVEENSDNALAFNNIVNVTGDLDDFIDQASIRLALIDLGIIASTKNINSVKNYLTKQGCERKKKNTKGYIKAKGVINAYMGVVFVNDSLNFKKVPDSPFDMTKK